MKIAQIDVYQVDLPVAGGVYRLSGGREYRSYDATIIGITAENGQVGWGESTPFGGTYIDDFAAGIRAGIAELAPVLIGRDPPERDCHRGGLGHVSARYRRFRDFIRGDFTCRASNPAPSFALCVGYPRDGHIGSRAIRCANCECWRDRTTNSRSGRAPAYGCARRADYEFHHLER